MLGKAVSYVPFNPNSYKAHISTPAQAQRMGIGPGTLPYPEVKESTQPVLGSLPSVEIPFHRRLSEHVHQWPQACPSFRYFRLHWREVGVLPLWHKRGVCRPIILHLLHGVGTHLELIVLSPLCGYSVVPPSVGLCCVFCGNSDAKMQWAGAFGLPLWWWQCGDLCSLSSLSSESPSPQVLQLVHGVLLIYHLSIIDIF